MKYRLWLKNILICSLLFFTLVSSWRVVRADDAAAQNADLEEKKKKVDELQQKLKEVSNQKISLSTTIQYINTKISLSQAEIDKTQAELDKLEREVNDLGTRIGGLEQSLDVLSGVMLERVSAQYKDQQTNPPEVLIISQGLSDFYKRSKYVKIVQEKTRTIMQKAENQKQVFDEQKKLKEEKQVEVEQKKDQLAGQQKQLAFERVGQQQLLNETKNNEAKYQAELEKTLEEIQAIQGIIAGKGNETEVKDVNEGDTIASIIVGASPCSNGTHLHFEVVKSGVHQDPSSYLSPASIVWNNSPDSPFNFSGGWSWPIDNAARINQGYGMTYYARVKRAYGGAPHTGIDMISKTSGDYTVKAVKNGVLFRGGISCGGRTLQYVRVIHKDDTSLSTYYLHVNY
jgi:peptidoglycan hydrolase CwlO-like protein